jgi:dsRNA-specific ribonuclease
VFHVSLFLNDREIASGTGRSKKEAQQDAAARAIEVLQGDE